MPTDKYPPFPGAICELLRTLAVRRTNAITKKKDAEECRHAIQEELNACNPQEKKKVESLKIQWCDAQHDIDRYRKLRKHVENKIQETIVNGDQPDLFENLKAKPTEASLFKEMESTVGGGDEEDEEEGSETEEVGAEA